MFYIFPFILGITFVLALAIPSLRKDIFKYFSLKLNKPLKEQEIVEKEKTHQKVCILFKRQPSVHLILDEKNFFRLKYWWDQNQNTVLNIHDTSNHHLLLAKRSVDALLIQGEENESKTKN